MNGRCHRDSWTTVSGETAEFIGWSGSGHLFGLRGSEVLERPVPCFFGDDLLRTRVERILSEADLTAWVPGSVVKLAGYPDEIGVVVLDGRLLSQLAFREAVAGLRKACPHMHIITLTEDPASIQEFVPPSTHEVRVKSTDLLRLPRRIAWARFEAWKSRAGARLRSLTHLPFALREALVTVLDQKVPLSIDESGSLRTVGAVAQEIGVSREHLTRAAGAEGIRLVAYLDACNALNALAEVEIEERSWSEVALCMGYPWQSGLTKLLKRGLGATPTSARSRSLKEWMAWWERGVFGPLLAQEDEDHTEGKQVT